MRALVCTSATFTPIAEPRVRWLGDGDFPLIAEARASIGQHVTRRDWDSWGSEGYRFCGIAEGSGLVASAGAWSCSDRAWELAAVWTREAFRGRGYAKAVCSFVTSAILAEGRTATCHTLADNIAMLRVAESLGYQYAA